MARPILRLLGSIALSALLAACTQPPAEVIMKGEQAFSRSHFGGVADDVPASGYSFSRASSAPDTASYGGGETVSAVKTGSIGVNELPPPDAQPAPKPESRVTNSPWQSSRTGSTEAKTAFIRPVEGKIITPFGARGAGIRHDGITIAAAEGEPVYAATNGEVSYTGDQLKGYGNMVILRHSGGKNTSYAHLSRISVERYDRVKQGDIIGYVGTSGSADRPQLYFAVMEGTRPVDPENALPSHYAAAQ